MCQKLESPCLNCKRVKNPADCENKNCRPWRNWYFEQWAQIHGYYLKYCQQEGAKYELEERSH